MLPPPTDESLRFPRGAADADGRSGYTVGAGHTLTALELESGRIMWQHDGIVRVLALRDSRLIVAALVDEAPHALRVGAWDRQHDGSTVMVGEHLELPAWV